MAADMGPSEDLGSIAAINMTPFVDVVLVLLVIFMVTAPMILKDSLNIKLPKAASIDTKSAQTLGVVITKEGQVFIAGELVNEASVKAAVDKARVTNATLSAVISGDTEAKHGDIVRAIDWLKAAGLENFAIQIERQ